MNMNMNMNMISIVIPTFNEAENIAKITEEIFRYVPEANIIIVDDNSSDGTSQIIDDLARKNSKIKAIHRQGPRSFGKSYIDGFKSALSQGAEYIFQMDADFSHDPKYLPLMLEKLRSCDVVIGSRYKRGGRVENWSVFRRFLSRSSSIYAKIIVGLPLTDPTTGFIGWRSRALKKIDLDKISSKGYAFLIEMKFYAHKNNLKIGEIPIVFVDRKFGASKMSKKLILEAALFCLKLRFQKFN